MSKRSECKLLVQHVVGPSPLLSSPLLSSHHRTTTSYTPPAPPPSFPLSIIITDYTQLGYLGESQVQVFHSIKWPHFHYKRRLRVQRIRQYGMAVLLLHVYYWDDMLTLLSSLPALSFLQFDCICREKNLAAMTCLQLQFRYLVF